MQRHLFLAALLVLPTTTARADAEPVMRAAPEEPTLSLEELESRSQAVLEQHFLAAEPIETELEVVRVAIDRVKIAHTRVQQTYDGVPVFEGEAIVHLNPDGTERSVTNALVSDIDLETTPELSSSEAADLAMLEHGRGGEGEYTQLATELFIFARGVEPTLAYRVKLRWERRGSVPLLPVFFIDANRGEILLQYDNLKSSGPVTASGTGHYYSGVTLYTYQCSTCSPTYYPQDTSSASAERRAPPGDGGHELHLYHRDRNDRHRYDLDQQR